MTRFRRRHFFRLLPAAALCSCGSEPPPPGPKLPKVKWRVTSTTPFTANIVSIIGGDAVDSRCLVPPGVSPHKFAPTAAELTIFARSDVVMLHGLGLENRWSVDVASFEKEVRVFTVTESIPPDRIIRPSGPGGPPDPHVWNDPALGILLVDAVENALKTAAPKLAGYFTPRAYTLRLQFKDALNFNTDKLKSLQPADRFLLTSHDTMQYFAKACGIEARALCPADGTVPDTLPEELLAWIKSHQVKTLFREPSTDVFALRKLLREPGVDPDHPIYSLTLEPAGAKGMVSIKSYDLDTAAGVTSYNCDTIVATLEVD